MIQDSLQSCNTTQLKFHYVSFFLNRASHFYCLKYLSLHFLIPFAHYTLNKMILFAFDLQNILNIITLFLSIRLVMKGGVFFEHINPATNLEIPKQTLIFFLGVWSGGVQDREERRLRCTGVFFFLVGGSRVCV